MLETYLNKTVWKLSLNVTKMASGKVDVTLLSFFDKGEMENVSDAYIKCLVKEIKGNLNL